MSALAAKDNLRALTRNEATLIAALHQKSFETGQAWSADQFESFLKQPSMLARGIEHESSIVSFVLIQIAADQAEILTLATDPRYRRQGAALRLLQLCERELVSQGSSTWLLDVGEDNPGALKFYQSMGFSIDGRRRDYYRRGAGNRVDSVLMSKAMARQAAT